MPPACHVLAASRFRILFLTLYLFSLSLFIYTANSSCQGTRALEKKDQQKAFYRSNFVHPLPVLFDSSYAGGSSCPKEVAREENSTSKNHSIGVITVPFQRSNTIEVEVGSQPSRRGFHPTARTKQRTAQWKSLAPAENGPRL